jgi:hypothetical protein
MTTFFQWLGLEDKPRRKRKPSAKLRDVEPHLRSIASRMAQAEENFLRVLRVQGSLTMAEAEKVFAYYKKHKLVTRDAVMGEYKVKHGAFLDREVIRNALGRVSYVK